MQNISAFLDTRKASGMVIAVIFSLLLVAFTTYGVTTISTNISTAGTLNVDSATTLNGNVTLGDAVTDNVTITGNATSSNTFNVAGNFKVNGYATTSGSSGNFATEGNVVVVGTASTTNLLVGNGGSTVTGMIFGTCNLTARTLAASTTANFPCTGATGVRASDKVFVMATSSLAVANKYDNDIIIRAASSSISAQINVDIVNTDDNSNTETVAGTLNFWAVR